MDRKQKYAVRNWFPLGKSQSFSCVYTLFLLTGSLHQLHNAETVEEVDSENEASYSDPQDQNSEMTATAKQAAADVKVMQPSQDIIGQNTGHVTAGSVRFKDSETGEVGDGGKATGHTVNGEQGARPKAKQLHRKNTPATLPTVQKIRKCGVLYNIPLHFIYPLLHVHKRNGWQ